MPKKVKSVIIFYFHLFFSTLTITANSDCSIGGLTRRSIADRKGTILSTNCAFLRPMKVSFLILADQNQPKIPIKLTK